jgi:hypothetical protein
VPDGKVRLLSLQRWGQAMKKGNEPVQGTGSKTVHDKVTLFWNQRKNKLSVPLGTSSCATFQLAPGHAKFNAFCAEADVDYDDKQRHPITADALQVASDNEDDNNIVESGSDANDVDWSQNPQMLISI